MSNKTIYYPPRPNKTQTTIPLCLDYNTDSLTIEWDVSGDFSDSNEGAFTKHIPVGYYTAGVTLGPYYPKHHASTVDLSLQEDTSPYNTITYQVTIQGTPC